MALIVDDILNLYYAAHIVEMEYVLRSRGYTIMILCTHSQPEVERQMLLYAVSHGVDGIILAPVSNVPGSASFFRTLQVPMVLVDREVPGREHDLVCADDYRGGRLAGEVLTREGHRSFLYISGPSLNDSLFDRMEHPEAKIRTVRLPVELYEKEQSIKAVTT